MTDKITPAEKRQIGRRLKRARLALGLSQAEMARRAGFPSNFFNQWELGSKAPSRKSAIALCEAHGLTLDWIFRGVTKSMARKLARQLTS